MFDIHMYGMPRRKPTTFDRNTMMNNMQAPWDDMWKYILDEHSDDESTLESDGLKCPRQARTGNEHRRRRFSMRRGLGQSSKGSVADERTTFVTDGSRRETQSSGQSKEHTRNRNWFERGKKTNSEERPGPEASSRRRNPSDALDQNSQGSKSVLDLMKNSMFDEEYAELHHRQSSSTGLLGHVDPPSSGRESRDDSSIHSDCSGNSYSTVESEFSKFVGLRAHPKAINDIQVGSVTHPKYSSHQRPILSKSRSPKSTLIGSQHLDSGNSTRSLHNGEGSEISPLVSGMDKQMPRSEDSSVHASRDMGDKSGDERERLFGADPDEFNRFIEIEMERMAAVRVSDVRKKGLNKVVCRSHKGLPDDDTLHGTRPGGPKTKNPLSDVLESESSELGSRRCFGARKVVEPGIDFPAVRLVGDENSSHHVFASKDTVGNELIALPVDELESRKGPQSVFEYEYAKGKHMDVVYDCFGEDPRESIRVRHFKVPKEVPLETGDVMVKVEASTVSPTDCSIRRGRWWREDRVPLPCTPGVDLVGKIAHVHPRLAAKLNLKQGDRVTALVQWGGNSRYATVSANSLVKVPRELDAAQAVCLVETFLAAFQSIHIGQRKPQRYRKTSLSGRHILVIGAMSNMGRAVLELARDAGATTVYAIGKDSKHQQLRSLGGLPVGRKVESWLPHVEGRMDLVIDASCEKVSKTLSQNYFRALNSQGQLVVVGRSKGAQAMALQVNQSSQTLCTRKKQPQIQERIQCIDVYENWSNNLQSSKNDLAHLLDLLRTHAINPVVLDRIALAKIGRAQETLEQKRLHGFLVCEPWIKSKQRTVYL